MKHRSSSLLPFALVLGVAAMARAAGVFPGSTDFEAMSVGALPSDGFFAGNTADASIVSNAAVAAQIDATNRPANFEYAATRDKILSVDADRSAPLLRNLNADGAAAAADSLVYADMLVKEDVVVPAGETVEATSAADKILVYFKEFNVGGVLGTNLCVLAGAFNETGDGFVPHEYMLTTPAAAEPLDAGAWHRIVLVAVPEVGGLGPGFRIYLDGYGPDFLCKGAGLWLEETGEFDPSYGMDECFLSLCADYETAAPATMSAVGFAGCGAIDDFVVSTLDPASTSFTLSWPAGLRYAWYAVGAETNEIADIGSAGSLSVLVAPGATVALGGMTAFDCPVVTSATADASTHALALPGSQEVDWYFPRPGTEGLGMQDGSAEAPFVILCADDLFALAAAVSNAPASRGLCYDQCADIDFTDEAPFPGIGVYDADPRLGTPFTGIYDGGDYFISNVTFTARTYGGIFNQVNGGTIKNLYVSNAWASATATGEYGFAIVGNAGNGATLQNVCSLGTFGTPEKPGTHNMAGIVVRVSGGGEDGTLVQGCVNAADVYGTYTKIAGVCAIAQHKADGGPVRFDICSNSGNIVAQDGATAGKDGVAGIVAYAADDVVISDCFNAGSLSSTLATAKIGEIVGYHQSRSLTGEGRIGASALRPMVHTQIPANMTNFAYAVVDDGRAETTDEFEADETYLLERSIADSGEPVFELENAGDRIAFDAKFGYDFLGEITFAGGEVVVATNGTVITYTAVAAAADPWFIPEDGAGATDILDSLSQVGLSANTNVICSTGDYKALVAYVTNHIAGATVPDDLSANQKANAVLCYALNATTIPDDEIADGDIAVAAVEPAANGTMEIAIAIDGLAAGDLGAAAQAIATRVLAGTLGGDDLSDLSEENITVLVTGSENGRILATVVPNPAVYVETPATFFVRPVISK